MSEIHSSVRELAVLQEATGMILSSVDVDTVLHQVLLIVRNHFGISNCAVFLLDSAGEFLHCRARNGYEQQGRPMRLGRDGIVGWAAEQRAPVLVPDVSAQPRYICGHPSIQSELALPLIVRDQLLGVLDIESEHLAYFTPPMVTLLSLFATQAGVALENARLYTSERRRMRQIELMNLIARSATSASDEDQFLTTLAELVCDTFEGAAVFVLAREADGSFSLRARSGASQDPSLERIAAATRSGIIAEALSAHMNVLVNDAVARPGWQTCVPDTRAELCVPMISFGETIGAILVAHAEANFFRSEDRAIAQAAADVCATAIKNVQLAGELRRVTSIDSLTSAYNQRYFHTAITQEISRARRYGKKFAVAMVDIRQFRAVNAALGFDGGDHVLKKVGKLLRANTRTSDTVCRYAGDRFGLVLPETEKEQAAVVLEKIRQELAKIEVPSGAAKQGVTATAVTVTYPQDGAGELDLVRALLARLSEEKKRETSSRA